MRMFGSADLDLIETMMEPLTDSPFFIKDTDLRYVAANSAMAAICGIRSRDALIGRIAADFFPEVLARRYEEMDRAVLSTGIGFRDRLELSGPSADTWLLYTRTPITADDGRIVGIVGTARSVPPRESQSPAYARVAEAVESIRQRFAEPLDARALAARAGISLSQLERDAVRTLGVPLRSFQHRLRIEHALQLLRGPASIAAIAHECGYSDQSAFTRRFRSLMGRSPRTWRANRADPPPSATV